MSDQVNDSAGSLSKTRTSDDAEKPRKTPSIIDQLSRTKTKEEIAEQKRLKAQGLDKVKSNETTANDTSTTSEPARGRAISQSATTDTTTAPGASAAKPKPRHPDDDRPSMALAPKSTRIQERSCSPGTMPDGSHSKCSGERGESYVPPSGLGKLANKLRSH